MSNDFRINISPNGGALRVEALGKELALAGENFDRQLPTFDQAELDKLRGGNADGHLVTKVASEVSSWLLGNDLNIHLSRAVKKKVRVVLNVARELRDPLAQVPVELIALKGAGLPLLINDKVEGLVHLLGGAGSASQSATAHLWPLRVLIVRSNPTDLGGGVPEGEPIRQEISAIGSEIAPNLVHVDLLSSETGNPATWPALQEQLKSAYDIVVYLGHGDLLPGFDNQPVLQFETDSGTGKEQVTASQFAGILHERPAPVVILAGCVTAAEVNPAFMNDVEELRPRWMQGNQGMAQALVDSSDSGVQFAVGMRYKIETKDAKVFLQAFFRSLLRDKPGHVEAAVRAGRRALHAASALSLGWSAPVVFSKLSREPLFAFLANPPKATISDDLIEQRELIQKIRDIFWQNLIGLPSRASLPPGVLEATLTPLESIENELRQKLLTHGPILMPARVETKPDGTLPPVPVSLFGALTVRVLKGKVLVGGEGATIAKIQPNPALQASGYEWLGNITGSEATFRIERTQGKQPLPPGDLFSVELAVGPAVPARYLVTIDTITSEPKRLVWGGNNAVIVPKP
jgi:hypothetical protein